MFFQGKDNPINDMFKGLIRVSVIAGAICGAFFGSIVAALTYWLLT